MTTVTMLLNITDTAPSQKAIRIGERTWLPLSCCKIEPIMEISIPVRSRFISQSEADRRGIVRSGYYAFMKDGSGVARDVIQQALITMPFALAKAKFPHTFIEHTAEEFTRMSREAAAKAVADQKRNDAYVAEKEAEGMTFDRQYSRIDTLLVAS